MYREDSHGNRSILIAAFGRQILGLDPATGAVRWEYPLSGPGHVEVLEHDGRLYCADAKRLVCLAYPSGEKIFDVPIPGDQVRPAIVIEGGRMFLGSAGVVTAYDLDGNMLWHNGFEGRGLQGVSLGFPGNFRLAE